MSLFSLATSSDGLQIIKLFNDDMYILLLLKRQRRKGELNNKSEGKRTEVERGNF